MDAIKIYLASSGATPVAHKCLPNGLLLVHHRFRVGLAGLQSRHRIFVLNLIRLLSFSTCKIFYRFFHTYAHI